MDNNEAPLDLIRFIVYHLLIVLIDLLKLNNATKGCMFLSCHVHVSE